MVITQSDISANIMSHSHSSADALWFSQKSDVHKLCFDQTLVHIFYGSVSIVQTLWHSLTVGVHSHFGSVKSSAHKLWFTRKIVHRYYGSVTQPCSVTTAQSNTSARNLWLSLIAVHSPWLSQIVVQGPYWSVKKKCINIIVPLQLVYTNYGTVTVKCKK